MVMMMNRAIWMLPSFCVICELCATHKLMSSQNKAAEALIILWYLPPMRSCISVVHGEAC